MVPVVCASCRAVFDIPESRLKITCPRCAAKMTKRSRAVTVAELMTGPLLRTIMAGTTAAAAPPGPPVPPVPPVPPIPPSSAEPLREPPTPGPTEKGN
jgi:DNA-directed RNA polymerase subunit RPC12/RpoP